MNRRNLLKLLSLLPFCPLALKAAPKEPKFRYFKYRGAFGWVEFYKIREDDSLMLAELPGTAIEIPEIEFVKSANTYKIYDVNKRLKFESTFYI